MSTSGIPRDTSFDATLAFVRDPYRFVSRRARTLGSDVFATRLFLRPALCLTGREMARLFYDPERFERRGALPPPIRTALFGSGVVQALDGEAHAHRKRFQLSMLSGERIAPLAEATVEELRRGAQGWRRRDRTVLYDALQEVLMRAVCRWAGVPLPEAEVERRAADVVALFDGGGSLGPRRVGAHLARHRARGWAKEVIEALRTGALDVDESAAARRIALHRDLQGRLLAPRVAADELLNVLRPTVAISVYGVFLAHALQRHPEDREKLGAGTSDELEHFVQEVRRFYPFFPAVAARVREDFTWQGLSFSAGTRTLLDLFGIDRDPRIWGDPESFRPERFRNWSDDGFDLVPQGGGNHERNHRCAGEWITIELMKRCLRFLVAEIDYRVPDQDLAIDFQRVPALPKSRFVVEDVQVR